ncbi:hypothetical protein O181_015757 [Austropuccinia psidii MF-1]|uniref:Uncharacterized protein n=1 Tax=Austropuccinia psidii MF-1 TaxID=1389203 RepID=A0A9Q3C4A7_9BASI|nr:hypothetical protein [Austropuccinia psidii MF-1]
MELSKIVRIITTTTAAIMDTNNDILQALNEVQKETLTKSKTKRIENVFREQYNGYQRLYKDCFSEEPAFNNEIFQPKEKCRRQAWIGRNTEDYLSNVTAIIWYRSRSSGRVLAFGRNHLPAMLEGVLSSHY